MGNTAGSFQSCLTSQGSPPHTWGILIRDSVDKTKTRITPTYMGNTRVISVLIGGDEDHPHIHGEYAMIRKFIDHYKGSPPHTWGIRGEMGLYLPPQRITPTYMGNTMALAR